MNSSENFNQDGLAADSKAEAAAGETAGPSSGADSAAPVVETTAAVSEAAGSSAATAKDSSADAPSRASAERPQASQSLIPFVALAPGEAAPPPSGAYWRAAFERRFQIGAIAAGLAVAGVVAAAASLSYKSEQDQTAKSEQDQTVVAQNSEAQNLADSVKALKAKVAALEAARREDLADLRKSVVELKSGLAAAHDSGAILAQVNARADRVEHDADARIEKLGERIDHDAATHNSEFAARLERLEKKVATPVVASVAPAPVPVPPPAPAALAKPPAAPSPSPVAQAKQPTALPPVALTKQPTALPPVAANVSKETTGSIPAGRGPIRGWTVRGVHGGVAIVAGPYGYREIGPGDSLPGAGRVERIERRDSGWAVVTDQGVINGPYGASAFHSGPYYDYGPPEGEF